MRSPFFFISVFIPLCFVLTVSYGQEDLRDVGKIRVGQLNESQMILLRTFLSGKSAVQLKDTIIIKYDYNHEHCWDLLDNSGEPRIQRYIQRQQQRISSIGQSRPAVSIFRFRGSGNDFNKVVLFDSTILIDDKDFLRKLLFRKKGQCGNSVLILPTGKYLHLNKDAHLRIVDLPYYLIQENLGR